MTSPRQVLAGTTYLITRRCSERRYFLRPSAEMNQLFRYALARAARRTGVQVHVAVVMSNHYHLVATDPEGRLPEFMQELNAVVARAGNAALGRWEDFWDAGGYSAVALTTPEDVVAKTAYVLANPVSAGLVRTGREWPGVWTGPEEIGGPAQEVQRPEGFFRAKNGLPEVETLRLVVPPGFESAEGFRRAVEAEVATLEEKARRERSREGFVGRARVLAQKPWGRPAEPAPRRGLNPRVAARDRWKRMEALARLGEFVVRYREALRELRAGVREALFPPGTYQLRVMLGVRCAPA